MCTHAAGERVATALAKCLREQGVEDPGKQFATMLGLAVAGFARIGADLDGLLDACREAYLAARS